MTLKHEIKEWLGIGKQKGATHVIVVCDTFNYEDYPVFVMPAQSSREVAEQYDNKSMQKVMEVYDLQKDIFEQLAQERVFNY